MITINTNSSIDTDFVRAYTDAVVQSVKALSQEYLDNAIPSPVDVSKGEIDMSKETRRIIIGFNDDGSPVIKQITANNIFEMNDRIVREYIANGRIKEFCHGTSSGAISGPTFQEYSDRWLETYISTKKPSTLATYKKILRAIQPAFGDKPISGITTQDIQEYLNANKELSKKTLKERIARLSQILDSAKEDGFIERNPAKSKRIVIPSDKAETRSAIPLDVVRSVIMKSAMLDIKDRKLLLLLITTGGRRGEVLGMQWQDVDPSNNVIHIRRNVTHANGNVPIIGTPKTKSGYRDVPYEPAIRSLIDPRGQQPDGFIVYGRDQTMPMTMTMYNSAWRRIQKAIPELSEYSAHSFRHTYTTLLSEYTDASPKTIQAIAGHRDIRTTMSIYEHARKDKIDKASGDIHNLLFNQNVNFL